MRITIIDNFINPADITEIRQLIPELNWNPFEADIFKGERVLSGMSANLSPYLREKLDDKVLKTAMELHPETYEISKAYFNGWKCDDVSYPHFDQNHTTCLIYCNRDYNITHGGETLFYDENEDAVAVVTPKAGRAVFFDGWILHKAGSFNRTYQHDYRYTIAYKLTTEGDYDRAKNQ